MKIMELFQTDTKWQGIITKIIMQRCRMRYKRDELRAAVRAGKGAVDYISMGEVYELHYALHPDDARRTLKPNLTRSRFNKITKAA